MPPVASAATGTVPVTVKERAILIPTELRPGLHKFVVTLRTELSYFQLIQPRDGYTLKRYRADMRDAGFGKGDAAARADASLRANVRLLGGAMGRRGQTVVLWQHLRRGRLWAASSQFAGVVTTVTVSGRRADAAVPRSMQVRMTDGSLAAPSVLAREGVLDVRNEGPQRHNLALLRLKPGKSIADVVAYIDAATSGGTGVEDPIDASVPGIAVATLGAGERMRLQYSLPAGDYVLTCVQVVWIPRRYHLQDGELTQVALG